MKFQYLALFSLATAVLANSSQEKADNELSNPLISDVHGSVTDLYPLSYSELRNPVAVDINVPFVKDLGESIGLGRRPSFYPVRSVSESSEGSPKAGGESKLDDRPSRALDQALMSIQL